MKIRLIKFIWEERWALRLGALVIVLAIGLDPFSQQLVQLSSGFEFEETLNVRIKRAQLYEKGHIISDNASRKPATAVVDASMEASIVNGVSRSLSVIEKQKTAQCFTQSCTWPRFETLGVCHRCNNLTDIRKVKDFEKPYRQAAMALSIHDVPPLDSDVTAFVLPNGHFLANPNECTVDSDHFNYCSYQDEFDIAVSTPGFALTSFGTGNANKTNSMQDLDTLIWSMSTLHIDTDAFKDSSSVWPYTAVRATECGIYYCVKQVEAAVKEGQLTENVTEITEAKRDPDSSSPTYDDLGNQPNIHGPDIILQSPNSPNNIPFKVKAAAVFSINAYFQELYTSNATQQSNVTDAVKDALGKDATGINGAILDQESAPRGVRTIWDADNQLSSISDVFAALAASMTNDIRDNSDNEWIGEEGTQKTYYRAEWGWLALHGAVLAGGVITWFTTFISSTSRSGIVPAWKSGSLAVIGHGSLAADMLKGAKTEKELEQKAKSARVRMKLEDTDIPLRGNQRHDPENASDGRESVELVAKRSFSSDRARA